MFGEKLNRLILFGLVLVVLLALSVFFVRPDLLKTTAVVKITSEGFSPSELTIERGQRVIFLNEDVTSHWPASDLHPTHEIYPEFDPQEPIGAGGSWSFTFRKQGKWRYHDHLKPSFKGIVTVE